jgi:hypothetical protein
VLHERRLAGQLVTRIFEGKAQVQVSIGYEAARVSLVTTAAGRADAAYAEANEATVDGGGLLLIAGDL